MNVWWTRPVRVGTISRNGWGCWEASGKRHKPANQRLASLCDLRSALGDHRAELRCLGLNHGLVAHDHAFAAVRQRFQNIPVVIARPNLRTVAEHDGAYYRFT